MRRTPWSAGEAAILPHRQKRKRQRPSLSQWSRRRSSRLLVCGILAIVVVLLSRSISRRRRLPPMADYQSPLLLQQHPQQKILLYLTTIFSETHQLYLNCCWPQLLQKSKLLPHVDVLFFSNNVTSLNDTYLQEIRTTFQPYVRSVEIVFAPNESQELQTYKQLLEIERQSRDKIFNSKVERQAPTFNVKQWGANMALSLGVSQGWFQEYDWVIRLNPDVLIRRSSFLVGSLRSPETKVDAVLALCGKSKVDTDFMAFRPNALPPRAFSEMKNNSPYTINHEKTVKFYLQSILDERRYLHVPDLAPMEGKCRVRGPWAPVIHEHESCQDDNGAICDALEGWVVE